MDITLVQKNIAAVAAGWSFELAARLERSALDKADFATLREAGLTLTGVPEEMGGAWQGGARSTRPTGAIFRTLARVDPSVALVAPMHPTVLALWLEEPVEPPVDPNAWCEQRDRVLTAAKAGHWFGTISSEPGGGGDLMATRATAEKGSDGAWRLTGAAARLGRDSAKPMSGLRRRQHAVTLLVPGVRVDGQLDRLLKPQRQHGGMHGCHQRDRRIDPGEGAKYRAGRAR